MIVVTHLWQSTLFVGVAALLAFVLSRSASARTRHAIWLCASLKFLVPFSALVAAGSYLAPFTSSLAPIQVSVAVRWLDRSLWSLNPTRGLMSAGLSPATETLLLFAVAFVWAIGVAGLAAWRFGQWRALSRLARAATPLEHSREARALQRVDTTSTRPSRIALLQSGAAFEPGILGIFKPRLLWPAGLSARLDDAQLEAILAHEVCHVDRRDNLFAAIHMVVETLFWFHPVVWWLGTRLVRERERACDEEVLRMGTNTRSYAEGILEVCGFCLRAPAALVAGVGGSHLSQRIEQILQRSPVASTPLAARLLLVGAALLTIGAPLAAGMAQVYRPGNGVTPPKLVREVKPQYTQSAKEAKIQGIVWLEAIVLETGDVGEITVTRSLDTEHGLDDEAVKAVKQWRFEPGTKDKKPVAVLIEIEMSFTLK